MHVPPLRLYVFAFYHIRLYFRNSTGAYAPKTGVLFKISAGLHGDIHKNPAPSF